MEESTLRRYAVILLFFAAMALQDVTLMAADGSFLSACGAVRCLGDAVLGKVAIFFGNATNNIAEYENILLPLQYATMMSAFQFQVGSLLLRKICAGSGLVRAPTFCLYTSRPLICLLRLGIMRLSRIS